MSSTSEKPAAECDWQECARRVQQRRDGSIAQLKVAVPAVADDHSGRVVATPRQYLSAEAIAITESPVETLLASLASGRLRAVAVAEAFLQRAVIAQKLVNCVYELLPEHALGRAQELDETLVRTGTPVGPLHGLPISVKSHIGMRGLESSAGFAAWVGRTSSADAAILQILLKAGAVLYVRTTEPQALMALETCSNVTGVTTNPHNTSLTPGGSSGGEGALLALGGSTLGIGSDIGGSIRSPAANCGIYGLRPTTFRLPLMGVSAYCIGCETIWGTLGPMSRSLEGIELFMKTILNSEPWKSEPSLHQFPWRIQTAGPLQTKTLKVGILWDDLIVRPSPPVTRALTEVAGRLKLASGIDVIEWKPFQHDRGMEILTKLYAPDGGEAIAKELARSGEPWLPPLARLFRDDPDLEALTQHEVWKWVLEREMFRYHYLQEWNNAAADMDVILCPTGPLPAPPLGATRYWGYTSIWNLLDYPAIVFPVTRVDGDLDAKDPNYQPRNEIDRWYHDHYSVDQQRNAPVGLQLVAKKLEDEKLVDALKLIKQQIGLPFVDCLTG